MTARRSKTGFDEPPVNDTGFTPQQVMEMGQAASALLQNPVYNLAHRMACDELVDRWSSTSPQEVKTRESAWHELQAHGRAAQNLVSLVERAKELLERQGQEQTNQEGEYLDQQGFGYPQEKPDAAFQ